MSGYPPGMDASAERFAQFFDEQIWTVYGFFAYLLLHRWRAEALTRRTFEYAFFVWDGEELDRDAASTWLISIARSVVIEDDGLQALTDHGSSASQTGLDPEVESALRHVDAHDRELLALRFGANLSELEIAGITGMGPRDVRQGLSLSLRALYSALEQAAQGPGTPAPS